MAFCLLIHFDLDQVTATWKKKTEWRNWPRLICRWSWSWRPPPAWQARACLQGWRWTAPDTWPSSGAPHVPGEPCPSRWRRALPSCGTGPAGTARSENVAPSFIYKGDGWVSILHAVYIFVPTVIFSLQEFWIDFHWREKTCCDSGPACPLYSRGMGRKLSCRTHPQPLFLTTVSKHHMLLFNEDGNSERRKEFSF